MRVFVQDAKDIKAKERRTKKKIQEGKKRSSETEDHEKQRLTTLKRLNRGDENELERKVRLEKVVASNSQSLLNVTYVMYITLLGESYL